MDFLIPADVKSYIQKIFKDCNDKVSNKLTTNPNSWETSLDMSLIEILTNYALPVKLPSGWLIKIDTHYLGGMRHYNNWEIADIGILLSFRKNGKTLKTKVALLQSKRLYPNEIDIEEDTLDNYIIGFGRLYPEDDKFNEILAPRTFSFDETSKYKAFKIKDDQFEAIRKYENSRGIPVYYLLYNPSLLPHRVTVPAIPYIHYDVNTIGCRVIPSSNIYNQFLEEKKGYIPSYGELKYLLDTPFNIDEHSSGWRLEYFISELFINCKEGYVVSGKDDINLHELFFRRSGPIAAAISITFDVGPSQ